MVQCTYQSMNEATVKEELTDLNLVVCDGIAHKLVRCLTGLSHEYERQSQDSTSRQAEGFEPKHSMARKFDESPGKRQGQDPMASTS